MKRGGPLPRKRKAKKVHPRPAPEPVRMPGKVDQEYLDWVVTHDCCVHFLGGCHRDIVPHHYPQGSGFKDDARTVGICVTHHNYWHAKQALPGLTHDECIAGFNAEELKLLIEWRDAA